MNNRTVNDATAVPGPFGQPVRRIEDPALLTGAGRYADDIHFPGMLQVAFVRSAFAHALIKSIDVSAARNTAGVLAVFTMDDLKPHLTSDRLSVGMPSKAYQQLRDRPILATSEVCHVGEAIAVVIAEDRYIAEDAAALVEIDYEVLPASADPELAAQPGSPLAHIDAKHNTLAEFSMGYGDVKNAFSGGPIVLKEKFSLHKGLGMALEGRGLVARYDPMEDRLVVWLATQMPHMAQRMFINLLGRNETDTRVITPDIGGGFGPKLVFYPEDIVVATAALMLQAPVKWIEDRREHFTSSTQERDQIWDMELAVDEGGKILGIRGTMIHDHGAYTARGVNVAQNAGSIVPGPYEVANYNLDIKLVLTNKPCVTPVRGAGYPQGSFVMERLLDRAAEKLGLGRDEIRRRNLIQPENMPYTRPLASRADPSMVIDEADFPRCMETALSSADWEGFPKRQLRAADQGRLLGIGLSVYLKGSGRGPFEAATVRVGPSGRISVTSGVSAIGQGTRTMLAQIVAQSLGVGLEDIDVVIGDTSAIPYGMGAASSRQTVTAGSSARTAAEEVRDKSLRVAAHILEASENDLEIADGRVNVKGVPGMSVSLGEIATQLAGAATGFALPAGEKPGLEAHAADQIEGLAFSNGAHVAEIEVDPETGNVKVLNYVVAHDCGVMVNPLVIDGQVAGGAAHGLGFAMYEKMIWDDQAQPQSTNLAEYLLPGSAEMPNIQIEHIVVPSSQNPLGVKGVGESGLVPVPAVIASAIENALKVHRVRINDIPVSPTDILAAVNDE
ncbi:MAG: 6-hydroxypseudooxynicotine dehydrogenase complex subunit gamma [Alphaproteobacteria bacterium MarineAlpha11_Bin1]|nr:MAG: 6-hydroxypseudooxynicotine dehydrogenase complex subunit gamma [Alphaproteobacteria bacterium MarineAlpha11_Bin1]